MAVGGPSAGAVASGVSVGPIADVAPVGPSGTVSVDAPRVAVAAATTVRLSSSGKLLERLSCRQGQSLVPPGGSRPSSATAPARTPASGLSRECWSSGGSAAAR